MAQQTHFTEEEIVEFLELNKFSQSYNSLLEINYSSGDYPILWEAQPSSIKVLVERDLKIVQDRAKLFDKKEGCRVGDFILLPDGQYVRATMIHERNVQTGNAGSLHLNSGGGISRSGSLDSGLAKADLIPTDEVKKDAIWIFHKGFSGAHKGVYSNINFRVFKTREGADLSGIPQIKELKDRLLQEQSETITRINGNGQPYTMHLPKVRIISDDYKHLEEPVEFCGISFEVSGWGNLIGQPMKISDIDTLLRSYPFKATYYNNGSIKNELYLHKTAIDSRDRTLKFS